MSNLREELSKLAATFKTTGNTTRHCDSFKNIHTVLPLLDPRGQATQTMRNVAAAEVLADAFTLAATAVSADFDLYEGIVKAAKDRRVTIAPDARNLARASQARVAGRGSERVMIWTVETIQRAILQEARRRWSKTGEGHDKLAPSLAVSLLSESKWYVSLVRWPDRGRKIVERRCEGDDLLKALVTIATGFVPSSHPSWLDTAAQHAADPGKHARDLAWIEGLGAEANTMHLPIKIEIPQPEPSTCGFACGGADPDCDTCG